MLQNVFIKLAVAMLLSVHAHAAEDINDKAALEKLNIEITSAEDRGDAKWLEKVFAAEIGFRRASGVVVGRSQFLEGVKRRAASKTQIESVVFYGKDRAIVTCIVSMMIDKQEAKFHNVRLFVREGGSWKLLGWANEKEAPGLVPGLGA